MVKSILEGQNQRHIMNSEDSGNNVVKNQPTSIVGVMHQMRVDEFSFTDDLAGKVKASLDTPTSLHM